MKIKKSKTEEVKSPAPKAKDLHALTQVSAVAEKRLMKPAQHPQPKLEKVETANDSAQTVVETTEQPAEKNEIEQTSPIRRMQFGVPLPTSADKRHAKQLRRQQKHDAKQAKKQAKRQLKEQELAERLVAQQAHQTAKLVAAQTKQAAKIAQQQAREAARLAEGQSKQANRLAKAQARQAKKMAKVQAKQAKKAARAAERQTQSAENPAQLTQKVAFDQPVLLRDGDVIRVRPMEMRHKVAKQPITKPQPVQEVKQPAEQDLQATTTSYYDATAATKMISSSEVKPARRQCKYARKQLTSRAAAQALATKPEENVLYVPALSRRPSRAELINAESRIGSQIFGPVPAGHRREFFHDQRGVWIWHEDWTDNSRQEHNLTVRYEVRPSGIYKKVAAGKYFKLEGNELENFRQATHSYLRMIKNYLYQGLATS